MRRIALTGVLLLLTAGGASPRAQTITATSVLAIEHWVDAVMRHTPGEVDDAVLSIEKLTMDDRRELNTGMALFLAALTKNGVSTSATASKRIADLGLDLSRNPGMSAFLERAAVLHGDAAMFAFKGVVVLPNAPDGPAAAPTGGTTLDRNMTSRNSPAAVPGKIPPLLTEGYLPLENDGEVVGRMRSDWNWVFARSLLDLLGPKHADDAFIGAWYHATTSFMYWRRLFGEASKHMETAAAQLPDDARILFDRACFAELQGLPRSQQVLSDEDLLALRMAEQVGQQSTRGMVRVGSSAQILGIRPMEIVNAEAERLFRRALDRDPRLFEARVRIARLLMIHSHYADALALLRAAPAESVPAEGMLAFYMHLFTARAERALGHLDAAADHAHQALLLFPDAQSALMASSQIAMLRADAAGAEAPLDHLASLTPDTDHRDDPWWVYDIFSGRDARLIIKDMWAQAPASGAPVAHEPSDHPDPFASLTAPSAGAVVKMLDDASRALDGDNHEPVRTFTLKGTKRITGDGTRMVPFEILCELPDKFVWKEDAGLQGVVIRGFDGEKLITDMPESVAAAKAGSTSLTVARDRDQLAVAKIDFVFWTLGLFASSFDGYPLQAVAQPTGAANAIGVKSRDGVLGLTMTFNPATHLPQRLQYRVEATAGAAAIDKEVIYADYRDASGRKVPFKVTFAPVAQPAGRPRTIEEYIVSEFKLNVTIDPKVFR